MDIMELASAFKGVEEGVKLLVNLRQDADKAAAVMELQQRVLDLQATCMEQFARTETEHNARVAAEQRLVELLDCRERLSRYAPVHVLPTLLAYAPKAAFKNAEPLQLLCAACREKYKIGIYREIQNGRLCAGRGLDVRIKCGVCGEELVVPRNTWLGKVAYVD